MFHHDPSHLGRSFSKAPDTNSVKWTYQTGGGIWSSPVVADGKVYVTSDDGNLYALDAFTGALIWSETLGAYPRSAPAVAEGIVFAATETAGGLYALNSSTGTLIWSGEHGLMESAITCADGKIYINYFETRALNATTGEVLWEFFTRGWCSSPAVAGGRVFVGGGLYPTAGICAFNSTTGALLWKYDTGDFADEASPTVAEGTVFAGSTDNSIYALDAFTGTLRWKYETGDWVWSSPAFVDGMLYVSSDDHYVYALNASTGQSKWSYGTGGIIDSSPAVADGKLYVGSYDGKVYCLNVSTGNLIWSYQAQVVRSSPSVAYGNVYIGSNNGKVYAFGPLHDVAVVDGTMSKEGYLMKGQTLKVNTTVMNLGAYEENFNVTAYVGSIVMGQQNVTLAPGGKMILAFLWNTTDFSCGYYTIKVIADVVSGETAASDNTFDYGTIMLTLPGDINGDRYVNAKDAVILGMAFNAQQGQPSFNPNADINDDQWCNAKDAVILGTHFNEHWE
jgi:outer membrane protein assembly factor BamB